MPTTPTSMVNRLMGVEPFTDGLKATSIAIGAGGAEVTVAATPAEMTRRCQASSRIVVATATLAVTQVLHESRIILLSASGGFTSTLPASTGGGSVYRFIVGVVSTPGYLISTASGSDVYKGVISVQIGAATTEKDWVSTTGVTITLNGTTKGGVAVGNGLMVVDVAAGVWLVSGCFVGSGTLATPFS